MARRTTSKQTQSATEVAELNRAEALRRLALITEAVTNFGKGETMHWGHAGSLAEVVELLGRAGHHALVKELTEN